MKVLLFTAVICVLSINQVKGQDTNDTTSYRKLGPPPVPYVLSVPLRAKDDVPAYKAQILYPGRVTKPSCETSSICRPYANCSASFFSTLPVNDICKWDGFEPYVCCPVKDGAQFKVQSTEQCARWMRPLRFQKRSAPPSDHLRNDNLSINTTANYTGATVRPKFTKLDNENSSYSEKREYGETTWNNSGDNYDYDTNVTDTSNNRTYDIDGASQYDNDTTPWPVDDNATTATYNQSTENYQLHDYDSHRNQPQHAVGGVVVERIEYWPFMAGIFQKINDVDKAFLCGASLITKTAILTAAHCFNSRDDYTPEYLVRFGTLILEDSVPSLEAPVSRIIIHPHFKLPSLYNDIALVRFEWNRVFDYSPLFRPICLPDVDERENKFLNTRLITMGWGTNTYGGSLSPALQEVEVPVVDQKTCNSVYSKLGTFKSNFQYGIGESIICAGNTDEVKDACQGDSGGPLISVDQEFLPRIVGVVSSGLGCGTVGVPGLYTRVDRYMDWIEANLENTANLSKKENRRTWTRPLINRG